MEGLPNRAALGKCGEGMHGNKGVWKYEMADATEHLHTKYGQGETHLNLVSCAL